MSNELLSSYLFRKTCRECGRVLPLEAFPYYHSIKCIECIKKTITHPEIEKRKHAESCKKSRNKRRSKDLAYVENERERAREYYHSYIKDRNREILDKYKTPCVKCGYSNKMVIEYHHINPNEKSFNIGGSLSKKNLESIPSEVEKCVCMCRNCHAEFHYIYGKHPEHPTQALEEFVGKSIEEMANERTAI